jgi:hypothetical protein
MNPLTQYKAAILPFLIALLITCFGHSPTALAVVPPPDGGYPGGNTAEGQNALFSLTSGGFNTAIGWLSLRGLTTGSFNTGVGAGTLALNNADQNTATGAGALLFNTVGERNTATGSFALFNNSDGSSNTAIGDQALFANTLADGNTAAGVSALRNNVTGSSNTAVGRNGLGLNTTGISNTAVGGSALFSNNGDLNTAVGVQSLHENTMGNSNTAVGSDSLFANINGAGNTAVGSNALLNSTGNNNLALGSGAGIFVKTADNVICIGAAGGDVSGSCFIGRIRGATTANNDAIPVLIDSEGQLGTVSSSRRFKREIKPMDKASEAILALRPITFHYKSDKTNRPEFGLIAEEVAEVEPDLVLRDEHGEIYTVRYEAVNAMLLNEFLKEHRKNEEQQANIALLQKQIEALTADLQKVSAQLELSKSAPQTVLND